jgi:hypothetical protein
MWRHRRLLERELERLEQELAELRRQNWELVGALARVAGAPLPQAPEPATLRPLVRRRSWQQRARWLELKTAAPTEPTS